MKKARTITLMTAILILALLLSGCLRTAPPPDEGEPTSDMSKIVETMAAETPVATVDEDAPADPPGDPAPETEVPTPEPPQPTETPAPTTPPVDHTVPSQYTLKKGEFPWCIARRFNINPVTLLNANGLSQYTMYEPGLVITIPDNPGVYEGDRALAFHPVDSYTVQAGDTFYSIACKYGDLWPEDIAAANGMAVTDGLTAGGTISIP